MEVRSSRLYCRSAHIAQKTEMNATRRSSSSPFRVQMYRTSTPTELFGRWNDDRIEAAGGYMIGSFSINSRTRGQGKTSLS